MDLEDLLSVNMESVQLSVLVVDLEMLAVGSDEASHRIDLEDLCLERRRCIERPVLILSHWLALLVGDAFLSGTIRSDVCDLLIGDRDPALTCFRERESVEDLELER